MTRCPTNHRNARAGACAAVVDQHRGNRPAVTQWAWCPDCRTLLSRPLVIQYVGVWQPARDLPPDPPDMARFRESA